MSGRVFTTKLVNTKRFEPSVKALSQPIISSCCNRGRVLLRFERPSEERCLQKFKLSDVKFLSPVRTFRVLSVIRGFMERHRWFSLVAVARAEHPSSVSLLHIR